MTFWRRSWDDLPDDLPVDVTPCSNGEFLPERLTPQQVAVMRLANVEIEEQRRRMGMTRREFVRSAGAFAIGLWAIDQVMGTRWGSYSGAWADNTKTNAACDLAYPGAQMNNMPGEFIFDVQSHHVESDGMWRVRNPSFQLVFALIWSQAGGVTATDDPHWLKGDPTKGINTKEGFTVSRGGREIDPIENLSRYHYMKELFLDSSTNMTVLSAVPSDPDNQPLPIDKAAYTVDLVNRLAGSQRSVMHAFVMPNRGSFGTTSSTLGAKPLYQDAEFEAMERHATLYRGILRGWKTYPAWGDVPYASGWYFDDDIGMAFINKVAEVSRKYGMPGVIASHKGFALPGFDQRAASPRDIGPAARQSYRDNPEVIFLVYHSGYDGGTEGPYPGDDQVNSADRSVNAFVKSLRENGWDATRFIPPGLEHGNVPNVYAEIGSTWRSVMRDPNQAAHLLGKLITYVGPKRICWGTDSLWFGSPQSEIVAMRAMTFSDAAKELYNLPYGLDGDCDDPTRNALNASSYMAPHPAVPDWPVDSRSHPERTIRNQIFGRNAARAYQIDPDERRNAIDCDDVQKIRDGYIINQGTPREQAPYADNQLLGHRTAEEVLKDLNEGPWTP